MNKLRITQQIRAQHEPARTIPTFLVIAISMSAQCDQISVHALGA
jgi:hypothetical protein